MAKSNRNTKRSSLACTGCKRSKRRCDIAERLADGEGCTNCRDKGDFCEVRYGEDKRRKRGSQPTTSIERRLALLEEQVTQRNTTSMVDVTHNSPFSPPSERMEVNVSSQVPEVDNQGVGNSSSAAPQQFVSESDSRSDYIDGAQGSRGSFQGFIGAQQTTTSPLTTFRAGEVNPSPGSSSAAISSTTPGDHQSKIIDRVVSREGGLESRSLDHVSYFGPTSIYHLSNASHQTPSVERKRFQTPEPVPDIPPECDTSNEPEPVITHLLDLFCAWQAPHLQIFHRPLFVADKRLYDTDQVRRRYDFFSPAMLWAIMALASMISEDRGSRLQSMIVGGSPGSKYFEKAKTLFEKELSHPSITTVQTALLMGSRYGAVSESSLGWTYSGIAIRMAIELGLHINCDAAVAAGQLSGDMAAVRKLVFWGCYVQDKLWSAYTGRPSFLNDWDITVHKPLSPVALDAPSPQPDAVLAGVHQNIVLLTVECSTILRELYSQKHGGRPNDLKIAANGIHLSLLRWHRTLPEALHWPNKDETPASPHVILVHMQFYFTLLLLHRPFIDFHTAVSSINQPGEEPQSPIAICTLAATNITKLARDYSLFYNLKQIPSPAVHFVFVATTIHLINHHIFGDDIHEFLFQGCLSGLVEMGESYPNSMKALAVLQDLADQLRSSRRSPTTSHSLRHSEDGATAAKFHETEVLQRSIETVDAPGKTFNDGDVPGLVNSKLYPTRIPPIPSGPRPGITSRWNVDPGPFDWSGCNTPVVLPSSLNDVDMESFVLASQNSYDNADNAMLGGTLPGLLHPFVHCNGVNPNQAGFQRNSYDLEPAAAFFDRFYGTTASLNPNA